MRTATHITTPPLVHWEVDLIRRVLDGMFIVVDGFLDDIVSTVDDDVPADEDGDTPILDNVAETADDIRQHMRYCLDEVRFVLDTTGDGRTRR